MSKQRHTPGPWVVSNERTTSGSPIKCIRRGDGKSVYNIATIGDRMPSAFQCAANACLIASAPELLKALDDLLQAYRLTAPNATEHHAYQQAKLAFDKATENEP